MIQTFPIGTLESRGLFDPSDYQEDTMCHYNGKPCIASGTDALCTTCPVGGSGVCSTWCAKDCTIPDSAKPVATCNRYHD